MLLENERKKVSDIALKIKEENLIPLTFGNFSLRDPETGYVCITPSGMPYETLHPSDIVVVDLDCNTIDGERRPSIETPLHTSMYKKRSDVNGIVHTHSTFCTAWACRNEGMPCITSEAAELVGGQINLAPFSYADLAIPYAMLHLFLIPIIKIILSFNIIFLFSFS